MPELIQFYNQEPVIADLPSTQTRRDMANAMAKHLDNLAELKSELTSTVCPKGICAVQWKPSKY